MIGYDMSVTEFIVKVLIRLPRESILSCHKMDEKGTRASPLDPTPKKLGDVYSSVMVGGELLNSWAQTTDNSPHRLKHFVIYKFTSGVPSLNSSISYAFCPSVEENLV